MADADQNIKMKIVVKTPKEKKDFEIEENSTVDKLKEAVAKEFNALPAQLCLIFAGKILKDGDTLEQHKIKDGHTIHLVIKSNNRAAESPAPSTTAVASPGGTPAPPPPAADVNQSPFGLGALGGLSGMSDLGMGGANFMEMQQRMQREMMQNP